jgi:iron(III) transport system substrate-binding protein
MPRGSSYSGSSPADRWLISALGAFAILTLPGCPSSDSRVVLYCAQDREYAEAILSDFTAANGVAVAPAYDTEAQKSVGLYEQLVRESGRPRCGVFWNNEILNTIRLERQGLLEPYESPAAATYPDWTKAKDRTWQAFAARARVLIVNTNVPESERPRSILDLADARWKGQIAIAKPQFGTTATQAACLFEVLGADKAKDFYRALKTNGVTVLPGNKQVAQAVAEGRFAVGFTDSDDAIGELNDGKPVEIVIPDRDGHPAHPRLGTLFIPNTLMVIKGGPNSAGAKKLVDYLLSANVERRLAEGGGYQIPLNPAATAHLHPALVRPEQVKAMAVDWERAADLWDEAQAFLRDEFAR